MKKPQIEKFAYFFAWVVLLACSWVRACMTQNTFITGHQEEAVQNFEWSELPWTGDDTQYQKSRREIDSAIASGQSVDSLRDKYAVLAQKKPVSPIMVFQWAYASWKLSVVAPTRLAQFRDLYAVPEAFVDVPNPRTYDYDRIRFLVGAANSKVIPLAQRLLKVSPGDDEVKNKMLDCLIVDYRQHPSPEKKTNALALSKQLIASEPQVAKEYSGMAAIYYSSWEITHDPSDKAAAIKYYQEYLNHAPSMDAWRPRAAFFIQRMKTATW